MSEIEKMYENAGIKPFKTCEFCTQKSVDCLKENISNITCGLSSDEYPPFTAEKQLELIKLLSFYYNITISKNFENDYTFQCEGDDVRRYVFTSGQDFAEQLASFVNMCYELLPEEEQQQIKEILE